MRKNVIRVISIFLLAVLFVGMLTGCGEKSDIKKMLDRFETSCKALDVVGVMDCVDPAISGPVITVLNLLGVSDTDGALDTLVDTLNIFGNVGTSTEEFMQSLEIEAKSFEFDSGKKNCDVTATFNYGSGEDPQSLDVVIQCIKVDDEWYISGIK